MFYYSFIILPPLIKMVALEATFFYSLFLLTEHKNYAKITILNRPKFILFSIKTF